MIDNLFKIHFCDNVKNLFFFLSIRIGLNFSHDRILTVLSVKYGSLKRRATFPENDGKNVLARVRFDDRNGGGIRRKIINVDTHWQREVFAPYRNEVWVSRTRQWMVLILVRFDSELLCFRLKLKAVPVLINLFKRYRAGYVMSPSADVQRETSKKTSSDTWQVARPSPNFETIGTGTKYHRHLPLAP